MTYQLSNEYSFQCRDSFDPSKYQDSAPWSHFVLDNLFDLKTFSAIQKQLVLTSNNFKISEEDPEQIQYQSLPDLNLAEKFLSQEFKSLLEKISGHSLEIYKKGALQLRRMTPESPEFPPHFDYIDHRTLVMLYYLSPSWNSQKGGELLLHKEQNSHWDSVDTKWVAPLENRLVLFFCDETNWHSVRKVSNWNRFLIFAEWSLISESRNL
ncbi:MAG TPA: 2OG-Fe(II) oxygenase [Bdellovibrio sp.]|uniref:2OG-Fe(II) oxygenase n=1 Tax=Bdellovibrio sp. TaxID=28201 RepID=UPI002F147A6D